MEKYLNDEELRKKLISSRKRMKELENDLNNISDQELSNYIDTELNYECDLYVYHCKKMKVNTSGFKTDIIGKIFTPIEFGFNDYSYYYKVIELDGENVIYDVYINSMKSLRDHKEKDTICGFLDPYWMEVDENLKPIKE